MYKVPTPRIFSLALLILGIQITISLVYTLISLYRFLYVKLCTSQDVPHDASINAYLDDYFSKALLK